MPSEPASSGGSPLLLLGLIVALVAIVAGLAYWYRGRTAMSAVPPPPPPVGAAAVAASLPAEAPLDDATALFEDPPAEGAATDETPPAAE